MKRVVFFVIVCCLGARAANYYVSSSSGNDANNGTSPATAWKTFSAAGNHINAGSFSPGDVISLKRGDVWNEQLIPPSSGASGNPIQFDAYGTGAVPMITAAVAIPLTTGSWTYVSGNVWKANAAIPTAMAGANTVDMVQFGSVYGRHQAYGSGCTTSIVGKYDWCLVYPTLYVFSGNGSTPPSTTYAADGSMTAYVDSSGGSPLISVAGKSWLTFQHIKVQGFSYMGVSVTGNSDNLVFANMESDGMLPYGTIPHGFYVNASGAHVQFANDDAHLNYDGFKISAAASVTLENCRGYANRNTGLHDTTGSNPSPVTYSYSHFYGNNVAQFSTSDIAGNTGLPGPIAGSGNIPSTAAPVVTNFAMYPARFSFTVDDVGSSAGTETYINSFLSLFTARGIHFNAAVVPSYRVDWASVNAWSAAGNEIDSHSWSHQYYTTTNSPAGPCTLVSCPNAPAIIIQYTGTGTAATLSISGTTLSLVVTGAPADSHAVDLTTYNTRQALRDYLVGLPNYSVDDPVSPFARPNTNTANLLSVTNQDIKSAPYTLLYDQTLLLPNEMTLSKGAIQSNVAGMNPSFYVYPDGIEDPLSEGYAAAAGYTAARGSLAMKGQDNVTGSANSFYSNGVNVQNITSLAAIQIHGMTQPQVNSLVASLVFRAATWGVPYGFFTHFDTRGDSAGDISNAELGYLLDAVTANNGTWMTNAVLASAITSGAQQNSGSTRYMQNPSGGALDLAVAQASSPTVGSGVTTAYAVDLNGMDRSKLGAWDIGASAYVSQRYGVAGGLGITRIGGWPWQQSVTLPKNWVNSKEWIGTTTNSIAFPSSGSGGSWTCGGTNYGPYTAGSQASLQQAINDAEACRTANGSGTTITIPAGTVFSGSAGLTLPQSPGDMATKFIVLQSSSPLPVGQTVCSHGIQDNVAASTQPGIRNPGCNGSAMSYQLGTTVTPVSGAFTLANGTATSTSAYNDVASMYTIECTTSNCNSISTATWDSNNIGPHHYAILNAELRPRAGMGGSTTPVKWGTGAGETLASQRPSHMHLGYSYIHSDWTDAPVSGGVATGPTTGSTSVANGVAMSSCVYCSVVYGYFDRMLRPGSEGHGIYLGYFDQIKVVHNWVEGQSSGLFTGGFGPTTTLANFGSDVEDRGNRYTYPYSWILAAAAGYCENGLACAGNGYVRKNSHEFKIGNRILDDGNINENVDNSGAQNGISMSWKSQNGDEGSLNYWIMVQNLTRSNGISRNTCQGMSWGFRSPNSAGNGGGVAEPVEYATFSNNLTYGISLANPGCSGVSPEMGFRINQQGLTTWPVSLVRDATGNTVTATLTSIVGGTQSNFHVGDPVYISGCTDDISFNMDGTVMGSPALAGTLWAGLTVVYANSGTPNATASAGCTLSNIQGWPAYLTHTHNSEFITNTGTSSASPYSTAGNSLPYQLGRYLAFTQDIFVGGGITGGWNEGTRTETKSFDPATEVIHDDLFPGRDSVVTCPGHTTAGPGGMAACYTEYSDTHVASTPATLYGVPASYCVGNDPTTENCTGVVGAMSQSTFPATMQDWHNYRLCHAGDAACNGKASPFAACGTHQAADGKDLGADLTRIDAAQTAIQYCTPNCGIGSYPDR